MLRLEDLSKTYLPPPAGLRPLVRTATRHPIEALREVSLEVAAGEIVGLVGPNGAGKSTLIKIVGTLLHPTSGRAVVDGIDVTAHPLAARRRMGVVLPDDRGLYWRLSGRQNLELFARLRGESRVEARRQAGEMLAKLGLPDDGRLVFGYSSGMRARLNLARAIGGGPKLLLLDEATRALDPVVAQGVGALLRTLADEGHAILLCSHRLEEVATWSDRFVVLTSGQVRSAGATGELGDTAVELVNRLTALMRPPVRADA